MQLFKNPFQIHSNFPGLLEILFTDQQPDSLWEAQVSQTFDGSYTTLHAFNPTSPVRPLIRASLGFRHPSITNARAQVLTGRGPASQGKSASWIFGRPDYTEAGVQAVGVFSLGGQPNDGDQVRIGVKTYTFETILSDVDGNVFIGGSASLTIDNLIAAMDLSGLAGTDYALSMTAHLTANSLAGAGDTMDTTAKVGGVIGNSIVTTAPTNVSGNLSWGDTTLLGGVDGLIQDAQFFLRLRRFDPIIGLTGSGTSAGAGVTYDDADATLDFVAAGVLAGDLLIITSGANTGEYIIDTPGVGTLTLDASTSLPSASAGDDYQIVRLGVVSGGLTRSFLIPRPYWHHSPTPVLMVSAVAPSGGDVTDSSLLVLPQTCQFLTIQNLETPAGTSLFIATDDDGPEIEVIAGDRLENLEMSTHLLALRGDSATAAFNVLASYGDG